MPKYGYKCEKCGKVTVLDASAKAEKPKSIQCGCGRERKRVSLPPISMEKAGA